MVKVRSNVDPFEVQREKEEKEKPEEEKGSLKVITLKPYNFNVFLINYYYKFYF